MRGSSCDTEAAGQDCRRKRQHCRSSWQHCTGGWRGRKVRASAVRGWPVSACSLAAGHDTTSARQHPHAPPPADAV